MASRYKLRAPAGSREVVLLDPGQAGRVLASWDTEDSDPTDLEMLCYPLFSGEPGLPAGSVTQTYGALFLDLQLSLGAGEGSGGNIFSTTGKLVYGSTASAGTESSLFTLPNNGVRLRFCARTARLVVHSLTASIGVVLATSITPIRTGNLSPCLPQLIPVGFGMTPTLEDPATTEPNERPRGTIIPKGARECRVLSSNPMAVLAFFTPGSAQALAQIPVSELVNFRPFSGAAYYCAIRYAESDWPGGGTDSELFEVEFR